MKEVIETFGQFPIETQFILMLLLNLLANIIGFIPSVFLTTLNIDIFGLKVGTFMAFTGEIFGAYIGFYCYRWGFSRIQPTWRSHSRWKAFENKSGRYVIGMVILLRLLPFIPSGLVTAGASLTSISGWYFFLASSVGKAPSVIFEVSAIYGLMQVLPLHYIYLFTSIILICFFMMKLMKKYKGKGEHPMR